MSTESTTKSGHVEREQIVFENFEWLRDVCSRLPSRYALLWEPVVSNWKYMKEADVSEDALHRGTLAQFDEALKQRRRGKRLVVIVAAGGVLYQFV